MVINKGDREIIMKAVRAAFKDIYGTQQDYEKAEVFITAEELSRRFPSFSKEWIKKYGFLLPRERVIKWDDETCTDKWGYCWNVIQKNIAEGKYRHYKPFTRIG